MARESARRNTCANNLKQTGLAVKLHIDAQGGIFPTGGWGGEWIGDPDKGFGVKQPGGWIYNTLPYLEQQNIRDLGKGRQGAEKIAGLIELMQKPVELFNCPSRRVSVPYPYKGSAALQNLPGAKLPEYVAKADYAINGVLSYQKSEVMIAKIQLAKGLSNTILVGEKSLAPKDYTTGVAEGDRLCMFMGDSIDLRREASGRPVGESQDIIGFGGPHSGGCNVAFCDGAVQFVSEENDLARSE
jgi:prepilin-type processing-associated H-X9-DG protein